MELSDQAFGKITVILAPYLKQSLNVVGNPMPEIKQILNDLELKARQSVIEEAHNHLLEADSG